MSVSIENSISKIPTELELNSYNIIAKTAAANPHWRKLGGEGSEETIVSTILSVMLLARELGIPPMQAISGGINNVKGKFEISARIMNQLIRKHGHKLQIKSSTHEICIIWGKRRDTGEEAEVSYHIQEASRAGLIKQGGAWVTVPQDMLFARAISRLARRLFPDCIGGCYVEGELQEMMLKEKVETIEVPSASELIAEENETEDNISLNLPENINPEEIEQFLKECSETSKVPYSHAKKRASENLEGFLKIFKNWKEKQNEKVEENILLKNAV